MQPTPHSLTSFIWHHLKKYKPYMIAVLMTAVWGGAHVSVVPYLLKMIIDTITTIDAYSSDFWQRVGWVISFYIAAHCLSALTFRIRDWLDLRLYPAIRRDVTKTMFNYLKKHSYRYFQNQFGGSLANKISDITGGIVTITIYMDEFIAQFIGLSIAILIMLYIHPIFAFILLGWIISTAIFSLLYSKKIERLAEIFSEQKTLLVGHIVDAVTNITNIKLFARERDEAARLEKNIDITVDSDRAMQWAILKMHIWQDAMIMLLLSSMLVALVYLYHLGQVTIGDFTFIIMTTISVFQWLWWMSRQLAKVAEEAGRCNKALDILREIHEIREQESATNLHVTKGLIEYKNIYFHHKNGEKLFENLNVTIQPGEKLGLVGFSGSGKTTFSHLLLRFYDPIDGQILIDGQDIKNVTLESLRSNIAMIPQDTSLFHRSLLENIRYGKPEATDEEVIEASKQAQCHNFISTLQGGYQSLVGERGIKLSGGQRQRIAIARAFLKNAPILILDEATSALDSVTEKAIQAALYELMQGRTTIVIAHRLSTLDQMDRILVFDKGKIVETGHHKDLITHNKHYAHMWSLQANGFLPEQ